MNITLINPNIVMQKGDLFGSGIPYMPMSLAWTASYLRSKEYNVFVVDAFGEKPSQVQYKNNLIIQGLTLNEIIQNVPKNTEIILVYAAKVVAYLPTKDIIQELSRNFNIPIIVIENTQSVVAYSLKVVGEEFLKAGADYIIMGEGEYRTEELINCIKNNKEPKFDGVMYISNNKIINLAKKEFISDLDKLPFPAWELFPLENYWNLGYAHGPMEGKYLPLLTSRGCPYGCKYCIVPETNNRKWRFRSAKNVVDEIEYWVQRFKISEFHIEDLNPTIRKERMIDISNEIIKRNLNIRWKIVAGTKVETLNKEVLKSMAESGCTYISISPESGSPRVLKLMDKPFNHELGLEMIHEMNKLNITTQACFVLGYPGENKEDLKLTKEYIKKLVKAGVDEVALFIMTPIPGSNKFDSLYGYQNYSQLTFSPTWRQDYKELNKFRLKIYLQFYLMKIIYHPVKFLKQPVYLISRKFKTKTEMTVFRTLKLLPIIFTKNKSEAI